MVKSLVLAHYKIDSDLWETLYCVAMYHRT